MRTTVELWATWAWLLVSTIGGAFSGWNLFDAYRDHRDVEKFGMNGGLQVVTFANVRREVVRLMFWLTAIAAGLAGLGHVPGDIIVLGLVAMMGLQAYNSYADRQERLELRRIHDDKRTT